MIVGNSCRYHRLTHPSINVGNSNFSPLEWASISWASGVFVSGPVLIAVAYHLDCGHTQNLIFVTSTAVGALFCLPAGFFRSFWLFAPYTAAIVASCAVAAASHTRQLGLMVRGFTSGNGGKINFAARRAIISWLSLSGTAAGALGATVIAAFTYHMLRHGDKLLSMWIVSIFSGLMWLVGASFVVGIRRGLDITDRISSGPPHVLRCFRYPHAAGSVVGVFFSSFSTMCIFVAGTLYVFGELCVKPTFFLFLWLVYFAFPLFSLPLLHPLQLIMRTDAVRMQHLGLLLSTLTSGSSFFFHGETWSYHSIMIFALIQSASAGVVDAFGRVLLLDCAPAGEEGSFAAWHVWVRALGTCSGFAVASAFSSNVTVSFGVAFCTTIAGVVVLVFGNVSNLGGAIAAGHLTEDLNHETSPAHVADLSVTPTKMEGGTVAESKLSHV